MDLVQTKTAEVSLRYQAAWACRFFSLSDCMVPQISLGTVNPDAKGAFEIDIPDFASDPIGVDAEFSLLLRETETWNHIAFLEPELKSLQTPGHALRIADSYPRNLVCVAQSTK